MILIKGIDVIVFLNFHFQIQSKYKYLCHQLLNNSEIFSRYLEFKIYSLLSWPENASSKELEVPKHIIIHRIFVICSPVQIQYVLPK